jgi:hypothetical protein
VAKYNNGISNGNHQALKITLDALGSIYVLGVSANANTNTGYVTVKYAPNGNHCHPVLAKVGGCKSRDGKHMRMKDDVSDSDSVCRFFAAAVMPKWRHACWKIDFFATH